MVITEEMWFAVQRRRRGKTLAQRVSAGKALFRMSSTGGATHCPTCFSEFLVALIQPFLAGES